MPDFDHLFSNDVTATEAHFTGKDDPFHLIGLGICALLLDKEVSLCFFRFSPSVFLG